MLEIGAIPSCPVLLPADEIRVGEPPLWTGLATFAVVDDLANGSRGTACLPRRLCARDADAVPADHHPDFSLVRRL